ncbi:hypothetical protein BH11ACT3_BH11ACT3_08170 [soil metagenome]
MSAEITHVRFHQVRQHEAIVACKFRVDTGYVGDCDTESMIAWLEAGNEAVCAAGHDLMTIGVVRGPNLRTHLRAYTGQQWTDALVQLPTF